MFALVFSAVTHSNHTRLKWHSQPIMGSSVTTSESSLTSWSSYLLIKAANIDFYHLDADSAAYLMNSFLHVEDVLALLTPHASLFIKVVASNRARKVTFYYIHPILPFIAGEERGPNFKFIRSHWRYDASLRIHSVYKITIQGVTH